MKTKTSPEEAESTPQVDIKQYQAALTENDVFREMINLKSDEYYRLQLIGLLTRITESLEKISINQ